MSDAQSDGSDGQYASSSIATSFSGMEKNGEWLLGSSYTFWHGIFCTILLLSRSLDSV